MASRLSVMAGLLAVLAVLLVDITPASAQGRIVGRYGDWQIRCQAEVGAPDEQCALVQNVQAQDRANVALSVVFIRTADQQVEILRVLAPLAILLPPGLGLSIDDVEVGAAGFVRCLPSGCVAEVRLDDGLIERFEAGETATFSIFRTPEEGIGIPISLNGFSEGFAALSDPPSETLSATAEPPRAPVATNTQQLDRRAAFETSFEPDNRTALDQLLEDELFPYVAAAAAALVLLIVIGLVLLLRGRSSKSKPKARRGRPAAKGKAAPAPVADDDEDDDDEYDDEDEEDDLRSEPVAPTGRQQPRLPAPAPRGASKDPAPAPAAATPAREPRRLPGSEAPRQAPRRPSGQRTEPRPPRGS